MRAGFFVAKDEVLEQVGRIGFVAGLVAGFESVLVIGDTCVDGSSHVDLFLLASMHACPGGRRERHTTQHVVPTALASHQS